MSQGMPYWTANDSFALASTVTIALARTSLLDGFLSAWRVRDHNIIAAMLGYPDCCSAFLYEVCVQQSCIDMTWAMAKDSLREATPSREIQVRGFPEANTLLSSLGVRAVPHRPCSYRCGATVTVAAELQNLVGDSKGREDEGYTWLIPVLSWPVEWSALHGIAEVRSPIVKVCMATDSTVGKYVVQWFGDDYPDEGASGLAFPYRLKSRMLRRVVATPRRGESTRDQQNNSHRLDDG
jgi:hypothetical protein